MQYVVLRKGRNICERKICMYVLSVWALCTSWLGSSYTISFNILITFDIIHYLLIFLNTNPLYTSNIKLIMYYSHCNLRDNFL
jgi:hypothetical protein